MNEAVMALQEIVDAYEEQVGQSSRDFEVNIDDGLQVIINPVPAEFFVNSHTHEHSGELVLHLVPPEAQDFQMIVNRFCEERIE